jgi:hypothetical protein
MSVLKEPLAIPSRFRGIYRYLLQAQGQRENLETLGRVISPDKLVQDKPSERPMFEASLKESIKCGLLMKEEDEDKLEILINPDLPEQARDKKKGDSLLPNTLAHLFFASDNQDEYDLGLVCAWYLAQDIYQPPSNWEQVQQQVSNQKVGDFIKMSNSTLYEQMYYWMSYLGLVWRHALNKKRVTVPDPTVYLKRNLSYLFDQKGETILLREFIKRLAQHCPLFETGHFREEIEQKIGQRDTNYLSTTTAFALFRLQDEGYIKLDRKSDAELMLLPKANNKIDDEGKMSHITYLGG